MDTIGDIIEQIKQLSHKDVEFHKKCAQLSNQIKAGGFTIATLVEELGPLLVDTAPNNRELGTWVLTRVLDELPQNHLDEKQLQFICAFYADRFKDQHQVIPAVLGGVLAVSKFAHLPEGAASQILKALFDNVPCQQQQEQDRFSIYLIFDVFLEKCPSELCKMEYDFVYGVISAVDGERNPKNLLFLFQWFPKFLKTVTLGHLSEEAFEVLACYFPVDFKAPTQDPNGITREKLATSLAPCLTALPQFAEFCFPLALEKLDSSLEIAKLDSLKLLELGSLTFEGEAFFRHAPSIWAQIQKEVFSHPNSPLEEAALTTLTAILKKMADDPNYKATLKDLCDTLKGNLIPDSKLFESSSKLLLSVAAASPTASEQITREIVPILVNTFNITMTAVHKAAVLRILVAFFIRYVGYHDEISSDLAHVPVLCLKASRDENHQLGGVGFEGLTHLCRFLTNDVRASLYDSLRSMILSPSYEIRLPMLDCFEALALNFSAEVKERLILDTELTHDDSLRSYFNALNVIAAQDNFTEVVIDTVLRYLSSDLDLSRVAIQTLTRITEKENDGIQTVLLRKNTVKRLIEWAQTHEDNLDVETMVGIALVLKTIIGRESSERQKEIILNFSTDLATPRRVFVIDGLLCRLRPNVDFNYKILNDLTRVVGGATGLVKTTAAQLLGNILNKCHVEATLLAYLSQFKEVDLELLSWIVKALVMRNHPLANDWTEKLLALLESDEKAAPCFRVIINDNFESLSPKSHCVRTVLYQQKFFTVVTNKLCLNYRPELKSYLAALGYLLESAPRQVVLLQFKKISKLVVLCLDECEEPEILFVILRIIKDFIVNQEKCIEEQLSDFLTRFLELATFEKSMKVRVLAVQCLEACTSAFPVYKLLVHKQQVLSVLGKAIDDKKRIVRHEAVEARSSWFLLDAPTFSTRGFTSQLCQCVNVKVTGVKTLRLFARNFLKMSSIDRIKQNAESAKQTIQVLKNELSFLNSEYNHLLAKELREENARLLLAVEEAKARLVQLEVKNGIKQIPVPNQKVVASVVKEEPPETPVVKQEKPAKEAKPKKEKKAKEAPPSTEPPVDIGRLDLRIAKVEDVQRHPDADSLYVLKINCGEDKPRTVCSGLVKHVPIEELRDRVVMLLCNLKPVKMRGITSEAMVMCASSEKGVEVLIPPPGCVPGEHVHCEGYTRQPDTVMNPKKKIFETVAPDLHTDGDLRACYKGVPLMVPQKGAVLAKSLANVPVK